MTTTSARSSLEPRSALVEYASPRRGTGMLSGRLVRGTSSERNVGRRSHASHASLCGCGSEEDTSQRVIRPTRSMDEQRVWITPEALEKSIKDNWLADRRAEWERSLTRRRHALQYEAMSAARGVIDDKQAEEHWKKEWLRRQRAEHEQSLMRRQRSSTLDVPPVLDASTLLPIGAASGDESSRSPLRMRASSTSSLSARSISPLDDMLSIDDLLHVEAVRPVVWQREAYPQGRAYPPQHVRLEQCSGSPTPPSRRSSRSSAAEGITPRQAWQPVDSATLAERAAAANVQGEADTPRAPSEGAGSEVTERSLAETLRSEAETVQADDHAPSSQPQPQPQPREQPRGGIGAVGADLGEQAATVEPEGAEPRISSARQSRMSDEAYLAQRARLRPLLDLGGAAATARKGLTTAAAHRDPASRALDAEVGEVDNMGDAEEEASGIPPTTARLASDDDTPPSLVTVLVAAREVLYTQGMPLSKTMRKLGIGDRRCLRRVAPEAAWGDF